VHLRRRLDTLQNRLVGIIHHASLNFPMPAREDEGEVSSPQPGRRAYGLHSPASQAHTYTRPHSTHFELRSFHAQVDRWRKMRQLRCCMRSCTTRDCGVDSLEHDTICAPVPVPFGNAPFRRKLRRGEYKADLKSAEGREEYAAPRYGREFGNKR